LDLPLHRFSAKRVLHYRLHYMEDPLAEIDLRGSTRGVGRLEALLENIGPAGGAAPEVVVKAILELGDRTKEGVLVTAVAIPWFEIIRMLQRDPQEILSISTRQWEEIIAGAYTRAGFDEVILTPRSGDFGRDVVATRYGVGSIRIFDQVKAYKPGNLVTAEEVRAMLGVITGAQNVSKGVITTTSTFAPRIVDDPYISPYLPHRFGAQGPGKAAAMAKGAVGTAIASAAAR